MFGIIWSLRRLIFQVYEGEVGCRVLMVMVLKLFLVIFFIIVVRIVVVISMVLIVTFLNLKCNFILLFELLLIVLMWRFWLLFIEIVFFVIIQLLFFWYGCWCWNTSRLLLRLGDGFFDLLRNLEAWSFLLRFIIIRVGLRDEDWWCWPLTTWHTSSTDWRSNYRNNFLDWNWGNHIFWRFGFGSALHHVRRAGSRRILRVCSFHLLLSLSILQLTRCCIWIALINRIINTWVGWANAWLRQIASSLRNLLL